MSGGGTKEGTTGGGEATELEGWDKGDERQRDRKRELLSPLRKELSISRMFHSHIPGQEMRDYTF